MKALATTALALALMLNVGSVFATDEAHHEKGASEAKGAHGHTHEGTWEDLGTTTVAGLKLTARQLGKVEAGKEGIFLLELGKGAKEPKAVRLWVGVASAEGSTKAKAEKDADGFEVHVEVPKTLSSDSALWVEIQPETGAKSKASFPFKK